MQAQASHGLWELFVFWFFTGSGLLGLPPGDRDPVLLKSVPPQTIVYFEWAARGPGQAGAMGVDGFVADPEIRQFFELLSAALEKHEDGEDEEMLSDFRNELPQLVKLITAHSGCLFLGYEPQQAARPGIANWINMLMGIHGGLILSSGDDTDALWRSLNHSLKSVPDFNFDQASMTQSIPLSIPGYKLDMHREGSRIIFALGDSTLPRILDGLSGRLPGLDTNQRFRQALERVAVPRVSTLGWVDGQGIIASVTAALGPLGGLVRPMMTIVGVDALDSVAQMSGVENGTMIQRKFVNTGGKTDGVMVLAAGQPIQLQHFAHIPADADLVIAMSLSLRNVFQEARKLLATTQPLSVRVFDEAVKQLEKELELSIVKDILPAFGDVFTAFDSPAAGGLVATSLVVTVEVRDARKAALVFDRLMKLVEQSLTADHADSAFEDPVSLKQNQFLNYTIYYVNSASAGNGLGISTTPTFCLTDRHLMFAIHPQAMKAQLRHLTAKQPGFDQQANRKVMVPAGDALVYAYVNGPRANIILSSLLPFIGQGIVHQVAGVTTDSFSIPSAAAIAPYFGDSTAVVVRQKDGLLVETRNAPPVVVSLAILSAYRAMHTIDFELFEEARKKRVDGDSAPRFGAADNEVVPARAQKDAAQAKENPSVLRKMAPLFLKALVPEGMQQMIPESTLRRLEEGPTEAQIQRREDARKRREERRQERLRRIP